MIANGALLRLNFFLVSEKMFTYLYIPVTHTFTIISAIAESTNKLINDTKSKRYLECDL